MVRMDDDLIIIYQIRIFPKKSGQCPKVRAATRPRAGHGTWDANNTICYQMDNRTRNARRP